MEVMPALNNCLNTFKNIRHFSVRKSTLSLEFFMFLRKLLIKSEKLFELDLSGNNISH